MPRSDRKKPTLPELASKAVTAMGYTPEAGVIVGTKDAAKIWLAGHRANRLTKAEREVVEAATAVVNDAALSPDSRNEADLFVKLHNAGAGLQHLERAKTKGGK